MKNKFLFVLLALVVVIAAMACYSAPVAAQDGTLQSMITSDEEYILVNCLNNIEYWNAQKYMWEQTGKMFGVKTAFVGPADGNINEMVAAMETAIAKEPAGICLFGFDESLEPYVDKAQTAGIPVVIYNGDLGISNVTYVGTSAYDLGYQGAKLYADMIGGKGSVAILTMTGMKLHEDRLQGFKEGFAEYPEIEVVAVGDTSADTTIAVNTSKDILLKYPDLTGFVCTDSTGATGASTALAELGMTGTVDVLGLDRNTDMLEQIKEGAVTGALCQNDVSQAYWAMIALITEAHIDMPLTSDNAAANAKVTPNSIYTSINLVNADNVDLYLAENEVYATNSFN